MGLKKKVNIFRVFMVIFFAFFAKKSVLLGVLVIKFPNIRKPNMKSFSSEKYSS